MRNGRQRGLRHIHSPMASPDRSRPAWFNWLILLAFLWSSWQLAGFWLVRLHG